MATLTGPSFLALQVPDPEGSAAFYTEVLGLPRSGLRRPGAVVFDSRPVPFALRTPIGALPEPALRGRGVSLWFDTQDADALHARLVAQGVRILSAPADGPFGRFLVFQDPDGYTLTAHSRPPQP
jgi:predicted enzyme related to lactoylglutathione lyase